MNDTMFWFTWVMMIVAGVVIILTSMLRRQRVMEMRHRERMAMIERGLVPPATTGAWHEGLASVVDTRSRMMSGGIVVIAFGLGLMLIIGIAGQSPESAIGIGGAIAILGAAFVAIALVQRGQPLSPPSPPPYTPPSPPPYPPPAPPRRDDL